MSSNIQIQNISVISGSVYYDIRTDLSFTQKDQNRRFTTMTRLSANMDDLLIRINIPYLQLQILLVVVLFGFKLWLQMRGAAQGCCTSVPLYSSQTRAWSKSSLGFRWMLKKLELFWWCDAVKCVSVAGTWGYMESQLCDCPSSQNRYIYIAHAFVCWCGVCIGCVHMHVHVAVFDYPSQPLWEHDSFSLW